MELNTLNYGTFVLHEIGSLPHPGVFPFPLMSSVIERGDATVDALRPKDIDPLVAEITRVLDLSLTPASNSSQNARDAREHVVCAISGIDNRLEGLAAGLLGISAPNPDKNSMLVLFRRSVATPKNLEALLRLVDVDFVAEVGDTTHCFATSLIFKLGTVAASLWTSMIPSDGSEIAAKYISVCAKQCDDEINPEKTIKHCFPQSTACFCHERKMTGMVAAFDRTRADPLEILETLYTFDWKSIFDNRFDNMSLGKSGAAGLFNALYELALQVMEDDIENTMARSLLHKLGSCKGLLHLVCQHIWSGEWKCSDDIGIGSVFEFLPYFANCLVPVPTDTRTVKLVKKTHSALRVLVRQFPEGTLAGDVNRLAFKVTDAAEWESTNNMSDEQRVKRLYDTFLRDCSPKERHREDRRELRISQDEGVESKDELCGNCFKSENDLERGTKLLRCSRCKEISYCCKDCQVTHWKKGHKKYCKK